MHLFLTLRLLKMERVIVKRIIVSEVHSLLHLTFCEILFFHSKDFIFKSFHYEECDAKFESEPLDTIRRVQPYAVN